MLDLSSAGVTKLVDRLSDSGWLTRAAHPTDRRARLVTATDEAAARADAAYAPVHQPVVEAIDDLDPDEARGVLHLLERLIVEMQKA